MMNESEVLLKLREVINQSIGGDDTVCIKKTYIAEVVNSFYEITRKLESLITNGVAEQKKNASSEEVMQLLEKRYMELWNKLKKNEPIDYEEIFDGIPDVDNGIRRRFYNLAYRFKQGDQTNIRSDSIIKYLKRRNKRTTPQIRTKNPELAPIKEYTNALLNKGEWVGLPIIKKRFPNIDARTRNSILVYLCDQWGIEKKKENGATWYRQKVNSQ